jgi:molybdopterin-binding protein
VKEIISDKVLSEIIVETAIGDVAAIITTRSVQDMGLKAGDKVAALVRPPTSPSVVKVNGSSGQRSHLFSFPLLAAVHHRPPNENHVN